MAVWLSLLLTLFLATIAWSQPVTHIDHLVGGQGTSQFLFTDKPALLWEVVLGTAAAPVATPGALLKISRTVAITTDPPAGCTNGIDNECGSALQVTSVAVSGNTMMNVGITAIAKGDNQPGLTGGSGDQIGLYGVGRKAAGGGTSYGAYLEGRRDGVGSGIGIGIIGAEITQRNFADADCEYDSFGGNCKSVWITGAGTAGKLLGVGAALRDANVAHSFQVGFACTNNSVGDHGGACFDDQSTSTRGIRIGGTHTFGIDTTAATLSGAAMLLADFHQIAWGNVAEPLVLDGHSGGVLRIQHTGGASVQFGSAFTFASLGAADNGIIAYCNDCTIASPCAGGGLGAIAKRLNNIWVCN